MGVLHRGHSRDPAIRPGRRGGGTGRVRGEKGEKGRCAAGASAGRGWTGAGRGMIRHALIYFVAFAMPGLLGFASFSAYTRVLTPTEYAVYSVGAASASSRTDCSSA